VADWRESQGGLSVAKAKNEFLWGAASAAYQVEGAWKADGRGLSKWDVYTNDLHITEATVGHQDTGNVAVNAYDRTQYLADIELMREAGLSAYRFSLSWPRILPEGAGAVNQAGLDHYRRFIDDLLEAGVAPMATLYHWDFPEALHRQGGWHNPESVRWFADYAATVFRALGDRVEHFVTLNEPFIDLFLMDLVAENVKAGIKPPTRFTSAQYGRKAPAMHNLLLAHAHAVAQYRALGQKGMIGIAVPLIPPIPAEPGNPADEAAATLADGVINRWPLDAVLRGSYPGDAMAALQRENPNFIVPEADFEVLVANPVDFLGVNFYAPAYIRHDPDYALGLRWWDTNPDVVKAFNGPVRPQAFHDLLIRIRDEYGNPPVFITENGAGFGDFDEVLDGEAVHDPLRTDYVRRHIAAALDARREGVDLRGYMLWSLLDNFEWIQGYERRFGIVHVDFKTQKRTPKDSFRAYKAIIAENAG
jgi:beta-glucosidase